MRWNFRPLSASRKSGPVIWTVAALIGLGSTPPAAADETSTERLQVFGYLTQAYGQSSRGSILGTEEDGTTDLGNVAVQLRWAISERDTAVVQLAHERRGDDLFLPKNDEVDVDWAFYQRLIGDNTALKVGRLNIPLGIYNEVRDVGTLLPFFSLPVSFYAGVLSSAETVDGISISHTFAARSDWGLDTELYFGGWDTFQQKVSTESSFGLANLKARAEEGLGLQLWLNTPVKTLRLGGGCATWDLDGPLTPPGDPDGWKSFHFSVDWTGERWMAKAEVRRWEFDQDFGAFFELPDSIPGTVERNGFYLQAGAWITPNIGLFGQYEETSIEDDFDLAPRLDDFHQEGSLSLNYRFSPDLLARIEFHTAETRFPLGLPGSAGAGADPIEVDWTIVAVSVSF